MTVGAGSTVEETIWEAAAPCQIAMSKAGNTNPFNMMKDEAFLLFSSFAQF